MQALLLLIVMMISGCQTLLKAPPTEFANDGEFRRWFAFYYQNPDPDRLPFAFKFMSENGYLAKHPDIASIFVAKIFEQNPDKVSEWLKTMDGQSKETWNVILISVWLSKTPGYNEIIKTNMQKAETEHQARLVALETKDPTNFDVKTIPIFDPRQINMLWAAFSVTGDKFYIGRIIDVVEKYVPGDDEVESQIGEAAIMTLANNSLQYSDVRTLCESAKKEHPSNRTRILMDAMLGAVDQMAASQNEKDNMQSELPAH